MEKVSDCLKEGAKGVQIAFYMLNKTYPMFNDPKVLLSISEHISSSFMSSVSALLVHERSQKKIPPYHSITESKLNSFKQYLVKKYKLESYLEIIEKLLGISQGHKSSVVEFSRDKKYFMFGEQFKNMNAVSKEDVQNYMEKAKEFNELIGKLVLNE